MRTPETILLSHAHRSVHESLRVTNESAFPAYGVVLHDTLVGDDGVLLDDEPWNIGTIDPQEQVEFAYDVTFEDGARAGTYILSTSFIGENIPAHTVSGNGSIG